MTVWMDGYLLKKENVDDPRNVEGDSGKRTGTTIHMSWGRAAK